MLYHGKSNTFGTVYKTVYWNRKTFICLSFQFCLQVSKILEPDPDLNFLYSATVPMLLHHSGHVVSAAHLGQIDVHWCEDLRTVQRVQAGLHTAVEDPIICFLLTFYCVKEIWWLIGSAPDFWGRGPGFESSISSNDPVSLEDHCEILSNCSVEGETSTWGHKIYTYIAFISTLYKLSKNWHNNCRFGEEKCSFKLYDYKTMIHNY